MCGIVGAVSHAQHRPDPGRGPAAARIPRLRLLRRRRARDGGLRRARSTARVADCERRSRDDQRRRRHRHRPHALGHARRAGGAQRAPALRHGPARAASAGRIALVHNGIIENHDELRAELQGQGLRVRRARPTPRSSPTWSTSLYDGDLFEAVQRAVPRLQRRLRDRGVLPRRAAPRGRRARTARRWSSAWAKTARTSSPPTRWRWPA